MKKQTMSSTQILMSVLIGAGIGFICGHLLKKTIDPSYDQMSVQRLEKELDLLVKQDTTESYKKAAVVRDLISIKKKVPIVNPTA